LTAPTVRDLRKLGSEAERLILRYLRERIAASDDPRRFGHALTGDHKRLWRYRLGTIALLRRSRMIISSCWL
jgi:mRNA interferase RelE/StbE